ncbi:hypothetical protein BJO33_10325 [Salmonella enterica subsp. enterica serovar Infantis]|nr:hypothetical protein [Salmonella enterica subsp. enterica serovar Infantis]HCD0367758.1 hypothetical protein [Salmonella enterica subsp. enterica serovar Infantis]
MNILSEPLFMAEVKHRASLLSGCFNPGKALTWQRSGDNRTLFTQLLEETSAFMSGEYTAEDIKNFWERYSRSPELMKLVRCLDPGGPVLCQRGKKGDLYSVPVFHLILTYFISDYLRQRGEINVCTNSLPSGFTYFSAEKRFSERTG